MDPQNCTKCNALPEDILMLACSHDLCLNCAADRLAFEMKKKKNANSIVCEFCYERTPLDAESVSELERLIPSSKLPARAYAESATPHYEPKAQTKYEPQTRSHLPYEKTAARTYDRVGGTDRSHVSTTSNNVLSGISNKRQCNDHPEEEILYFCFDCKCECICPECVIHGKHKEHDVKTIRKAQPVVKAEVNSIIQKMENNADSLLIRKSEVEKQIRNINEQNIVSKRQIQQAFEDLRAKINAQEKEILSRCDQNASLTSGELQKSLKGIVTRVEDIKGYTSTIRDAEKKQDIVFLNFYAKKWQEMRNEEKEPEREIPHVAVPSNEPILTDILDVSDHASRIGGHANGKSRGY